MPDRVRIIAGPRRVSFDSYVERLVSERGYGVEREYFGVETAERADEVRRGLRQAGRHLTVAVRAYYRPCKGCAKGGKSCAFHVFFTAFPRDDARRYMEKKKPRA
ncbi:MAG: hypothetical protein M0010_15385 [Actinomycetota bacterium]|nr:hypothetical protein [Actinomycetota bacterium]